MESFGPQLDHLFVFVRPGAPEAAALERAGLRASYRRRHPGQGTANVCYCFDNAYLELLWIEDEAETTAPAVVRTRLAERADWRRTGTSPFGIALRGGSSEELFPGGSWEYAAPFLPPGLTVPVASASADLGQPFLFRSPGSQRPDAWTDGRAGTRQRPAGLIDIAALRLDLPATVRPAPDLRHLEERGVLSLGSNGAGHGLILTLSRSDGRAPRQLSLPDFAWLD